MKLDQVRNVGDCLVIFDRDISFKRERMALRKVLYDTQISELMYKIAQKQQVEEKGEIQ